MLLFQYENLRSQATAMKDKYEDRINDLESERDTLEEERNEALEHANKQQEVKAPSGGDSSNQSVVGEVIINYDSNIKCILILLFH